MARSHALGRRGERLAAAALSAAGWLVLETNFRRGHREIDLIARRGSVVAFVEVKTRLGADAWGPPLAAITRRKRREVEAVARFWAARHGTPDAHYRFDAVGVVWPDHGPPRIEHVEGAWRLGE